MIRVVTFFVAAFGLCFPALAQLPKADFKGSLVSTAPLAIAFQTDTGDGYIASIDPNRTEGITTYSGIPAPEVKVTGRVTRKFLKRGMVIRFAAPIENKRRVVGTVDQVTAIPSVAGMRMGVLEPDDFPELKIPDGEKLVIARIGSIKAEFMTLSYLGGSMRVEIPKDLLVLIDHNDIRIGQRGDPVSAKGFMATPTRIFATEVTIERIDPEAGVAEIAPIAPDFSAIEKEDKTPRGKILKVN